MASVENIYNAFVSNGVEFFTGVPDSLLKSICSYITDHTSKENNIIASNEGAAIGIAVGYYLATGKIPLVYMQNSGIGNATNPLLSLADEKVYSIPLLLMIGWRGEPNTKDEPQHKKQGEVTIDLLDAMKIPYIVLLDNDQDALLQINDIVKKSIRDSKPYAILIKKGIFENYDLIDKKCNNFPLSREEALQIIVDHISKNDIIISTTGKLSRELFEYRELLKDNHAQDFLTVGSMGHSSSIAFGIAIKKKNRTVYCLDGDGAFIMHMGAITNTGVASPVNFKHILFNNGAHESVGVQPTLGFDINIPSIALASGYKKAISVDTKEKLAAAMKKIINEEGPLLLEIKVNTESRKDLGRPTMSTIDNKDIFMNFILNDK